MDRVTADLRGAARVAARRFIVRGHDLSSYVLAQPVRSGIAHPPDGVADIVGDEQRAGAVDRDADRAAARLAVRCR